MSQQSEPGRSSGLRNLSVLILLLLLGLVIFFSTRTMVNSAQEEQSEVATPTTIAGGESELGREVAARPSPTAKPSPSSTPTATTTPTPTSTPTPTVTPTPTLDLASCNLSGCGAVSVPLPTVEYETNLLLRTEPAQRRLCEDCPANDVMSAEALDELLKTDAETLDFLQEVALSQNPYEIAPGIVYIVSDYVHHVVIDLEESGYILRNIIPPIPDVETQESIRITPSYCFRPETLVVTTADYHGLVGSNKTESGRELFFHLGRAALYQLDGQYDIDVIREYDEFARTSVSWGAGPIFIWDGEYDFNPEQEWFDEESLEYYGSNEWAKLSVAVSEDRKYLFLSVSYGLTLEEHANNIIDLGRRWGITVDRAMRFDSTESTYLAIRLGEHLVPVLELEEPLIVNCFAVEKIPAVSRN
jgi:hypothetical protein